MTGRAKRIRCRDLPGPEGLYVAFPNGLRAFDDDAAEALAQNGMMLSLSPAHAKRLIREGIEASKAREEEREAVGLGD